MQRPCCSKWRWHTSFCRFVVSTTYYVVFLRFPTSVYMSELFLNYRSISLAILVFIKKKCIGKKRPDPPYRHEPSQCQGSFSCLGLVVLIRWVSSHFLFSLANHGPQTNTQSAMSQAFSATTCIQRSTNRKHGRTMENYKSVGPGPAATKASGYVRIAIRHSA